ncbi:MAG: ankyrin repeat domain-containing protein [Bacteroidales bacterium]|jgi:ankyrin repeat protein
MVAKGIITRIKVIAAAGFMWFIPFVLSAQISVIDTSEYIPLFYDGALDYNLMVAASKGYTSEIERMLNQGADVDATTAEDATPLIFAIANFRTEAVMALLNKGADPNKVTVRSDTPLLIAIKNLNSKTVDVLKEYGASIDSLVAVITDALIRHGANINARDKWGVTPLNYASVYGFADLADMLLYYGAESDLNAFDGTTPLMSAVWSGNDNIADLLIQYGANLESRDIDGFTPFLIAAQNGDTIMLSILMKNGVDIYEKNIDRWDALDLAIRSGQNEAAEWLIRNGDKWKEQSAWKINYYDVAANYGRREMLNFLEKNDFPSKYHPRFNELDLSLSSKFNTRDIYTGFSLSLKEPRRNIGVIAGLDTKLWYTRVIVQKSSDLFYQYMDKSSLAYIGVFKDFRLTDDIFRSNILISPSLEAAYSFGNKFMGTDISPEDKFKIIPAVTLKVKKKNFTLFSSVEYTNTNFYGIWPVWLRIGLSGNFYFNFVKTSGKQIKWY